MTQPDRDQTRACIRDAAIEVVVERGYAGTTLELVLERAELSPAAFQQHFDDLDACLTAVWDELTQVFLEVTGGAFAAAEGWREGMRASGWAYCRFLQEDHDRARFLIELSFRSELVQASRDFIMDAYAELVHSGRHERPQAADASRHLAEGIVGAIWERIASTVVADRFQDFPELIPEMMYMVAMPYLGPEAAQEELRRGPADIAHYRRGEL
jgi:AcrR family transcriptional regulator